MHTTGAIQENDAIEWDWLVFTVHEQEMLVTFLVSRGLVCLRILWAMPSQRRLTSLLYHRRLVNSLSIVRLFSTIIHALPLLFALL